jgi:hypothetical protein
MGGDTPSSFLRRNGSMPNGTAGLLGEDRGGIGVTERLGARQEMLGVVRVVIDQGTPGDHRDIRCIDERHSAVVGRGDDLTVSHSLRDEVIAGEVLHEP